MSDQYVVVTGTFGGGLSVVGPFENEDKANEYADGSEDTCEVMALIDPSDQSDDDESGESDSE